MLGVGLEFWGSRSRVRCFGVWSWGEEFGFGAYMHQQGAVTSRGGGGLFSFGELSLITTRPCRLIPTSGLNFVTVPTAVPLFWKSFRRYRCITES